MQPTKKLFAVFTNSNWETKGEPLEIKNEQEAVDHALKTYALYFSTYEVESVVLNGKELCGKPENYSARRYVGIGQVYTKAELMKVSRSAKRLSDDQLYMTGLERPDEFTSVGANDKVFNRQGQQIWPKAAAPAPKTGGAPKP